MLSKAIREKIEERFGKAIRYSKDCEALAVSIHKACQERISATTLKRLFGFAQTVEQPRQYTLDLLALYTGFPNWESLQAVVENANAKLLAAPVQSKTQASLASSAGVYRLNHQISISQATQSVEVNKVTALANEFGHEPAIIPFITEMIGIAARQNNVAFLAEVFSLPRIFDKGVHGEFDLYFIGQAMGMVLRNNPAIAQQLIDPLASNGNARRYLIEWFVDEDYLLDYYGKLLDAYHPFKKAHIGDRLFYYTLKYKQSLLEGDVVSRIVWYKKMKQLKLPTILFEVLPARYVGVCLSEERDHIFSPASPYYVLIQQYTHQNSYDHSVNFVFFLSRELFMYKREDWLVQLLVDFDKLYSKSQPASVMHWTVNLENQLLVYHSFVAHLLGNSKKATDLIKKVDPNLFDPFIYQQMQNDYSQVKRVLKL